MKDDKIEFDLFLLIFEKSPVLIGFFILFCFCREWQLNTRSASEYYSIPIRKENVQITEMHREDSFLADQYRIEVSRRAGPITDLYISHEEMKKHPYGSEICIQYRIFQNQETGIELCKK